MATFLNIKEKVFAYGTGIFISQSFKVYNPSKTLLSVKERAKAMSYDFFSYLNSLQEKEALLFTSKGKHIAYKQLFI